MDARKFLYAPLAVGGYFLLYPLNVQAQEEGGVEYFGVKGKLFSILDAKDKAEKYYILSRRSYSGEDSGGYLGQIRIEVNYKTGGFEIKTFEYQAACYHDGKYDIFFEKNGDEIGPQGLDNRNVTDKPNSSSKKAAFNCTGPIPSG